MGKNIIPGLKIGDLELPLPIIQGGMGIGVSLSGLASAVANEGAIGVIAASSIGIFEPDFAKDFRGACKRRLRKEIRTAREKTKGIIGVNIMVALENYNDMISVATEEKADLILLGAGLPLKQLPLEQIVKNSIKIIPIVSSGRATKLIFTYWRRHFKYIPDAVVVEGPLAGGHLGFKKDEIDSPENMLEKLIPEVISAVDPFEKQFKKVVPVIAAGGIYTGTDIYKFLQLGAKGVQMSTRFVATHECDASMEFKEEYIKCKKEDIVIIESPAKMPGRAIKNQFLEDVVLGKKKPFSCPYYCLKTCDVHKTPYCITIALKNAKLGKLKSGFVFCGSNASRVDKIISVKELINELLKEYEAAACSASYCEKI